MKPEQIMQQLNSCSDSYFPAQAIRAALQQKAEITEHLLAALACIVENYESYLAGDDSLEDYFPSMFILAELREQKAFPFLIQLLERLDNGEQDDDIAVIFGDEYPEYLPSLLASTYDGDDQRLIALIKDKSKNEFVRGCALQVFPILYLNGKKTRQFIVDTFLDIIETRDKDDVSFLYDDLCSMVGDLYLIELIDKLPGLADAMSDDYSDDELEDCITMLKELNEQDSAFEINMNVYPYDSQYHFIDNAETILRDLYGLSGRLEKEFEESIEGQKLRDFIEERASAITTRKKTGRNEPCYCGSGKKYKNCCYRYKQIMNDISEVDLNDSTICIAKWFAEKGHHERAINYYNMAARSIPGLIFNHSADNLSLSQYENTTMSYIPLLQWINDFVHIAKQSDSEAQLTRSMGSLVELQRLFDKNAPDNAELQKLLTDSIKSLQEKTKTCKKWIIKIGTDDLCYDNRNS